MIEPVSDALTTSIRPAWRAKNAMISSAMLPNVALRMPPTCGPVSDPRRSVDRPTTQASPRIAAADTTNRTRLVGVQPEVEDDRDEAQDDRRRCRTTAAEHRELAEDREAGAPGPAWSVIARILAERGRRRRAGGAGSRSRPRPAGPRRRGPSRRRRAARPRPARPRARRPRRPRPPRSRHGRPASAPDDERELAARRDRARRRPPSASSPSVPRTIVSWSLVSSRQTAAGRSRAARRGQVAQRRRDAPRRLEARPCRARRRRSGASRSRRSRPDPRQEPLERPARPGHARSRRPRRARPTRRGSARRAPPSAAQAATSSPPGSLTAGVPASVTSARSAPPRRCSSSAAARAGAAPGVVADVIRVVDAVAVEQPARERACPRRRSAARPAGPRAPAA